jgi:hypothetical protein
MRMVSYLLWWGALPLQVLLLGLLLRRRGLREFPCFFSYALFAVVAGILRLVVHKDASLYFPVYWTTDVIFSALAAASLYEVFRTVFRGFSASRWVQMLFWSAVLGSILLALGLVGTVPAGAHGHPVVRWIVAGELGLKAVQVVMFVCLVAFVFLFGLQWRQSAFGISAGFGVYGTVALLSYTKYYEIGTRFLLPWNVLSVAAYNLAVLIWLWYFTGPLVPETPRISVPPLSMRELQDYQQALRKVRRP